MAITEGDIQARLAATVDPNTGRDFVAGKSIRRILIEGSDVTIDLQLPYPAIDVERHTSLAIIER